MTFGPANLLPTCHSILPTTPSMCLLRTVCVPCGCPASICVRPYRLRSQILSYLKAFEDGAPLKRVRPARRSYFGEMSLLSSKAFGSRRFHMDRRTCTITARTICDVVVLAKSDLENVVNEFPVLLNQMLSVANE